MGGHGKSREQVAYAPLHEHAFISVRIVGRPEFMMPPHGSIVGAASAGRTGLECHIREFRRQRIKNVFIAPHIVNGQIPLASSQGEPGSEILRLQSHLT